MDIQYHYFVIKTLAVQGGFSEEEAQTIAYYSQQVDDFTKCMPMYADQEPPAFFTENGYAAQGTDGRWMVVPHPTGIDVVQSLEEHYRYTTLAPFHFIPPRSFEETEKNRNFTRADYRCVQASDKERAVLINEIIRAAVENVKSEKGEKSEKSLMELGMALHTYADTYAHCGYSGLTGWENKAVIKKAFNQKEGREEVTDAERLFYKALPHIGHGNSGHVPDICSYRIDVAMPSKEDDEDYSEHIIRGNLENFLLCSHSILDILCEAAGRETYSDDAWKELSGRLSSAMPVKTSEETESRMKQLAGHWQEFFPDISYFYEKNERFYQRRQETGEENGIAVYCLTQAFYDFNELAYKRAETVLGKGKGLAANKQMLMEAVQEKEALRAEQAWGAETKPAGQADGIGAGMASAANGNGNWESNTALGTAVCEAGFSYLPQRDTLYSAYNSIQHAYGYCRAYDEAAPAIGIIADCEPIRFFYDGREWILVFRKGQYGIGTGGEMGLYDRECGEEAESAEEAFGIQYSCVPDKDRIDMCFSLYRDGELVCESGWTKHWWLFTGRWGIFSRPEQLTMKIGLRFPDENRKEAFLSGGYSSGMEMEGFGLKAAGYSYEEPAPCTVQFCFAEPHAMQPAIYSSVGETMQKINEEMTGTYNKMKEKLCISTNDPNVINEMLAKHGGIVGKRLHEKLLMHYQRQTVYRKECMAADSSVISIGCKYVN